MPKYGEVLNLHIGQAGCVFGATCWQLYCLEHGVEANGTYNCNEHPPNTFFYETGGGKAVPRAGFFDLEPTVLDEIRTGSFRHLFSPMDLVNGKEDAANCFGRGFVTLGKEMVAPVMNRIRTMAEGCSGLQGFMIFRSYGGGTGSGFVARLLEELAHDYPKVDKFDFSIYLSPKLSSVPVEPYNNAFALHHSLEYSCASFVLDNEACYDICDRLLDVCEIRYVNINRLLAQVISCVTASLRYDGSININMNEIRTNLIPYPRLQYPIISCAPLIPKNQSPTQLVTEASLINSCFESSNQLVKCDVKKGMYMSCTLLFRGRVNNACINSAIQTLKAKKSINFVKWSPIGFKIGVNNTPAFTFPSGDMARMDKCCVMLANCTHVKTVFENISRKFDMLYAKKAFVHWYIAEGLEEGDFHDTRLDLTALENDYNEIESEK